MFSAEQVAAATGAPLPNVRAHWPRLTAALAARGVNSPDVQAGVIATIAAEVPAFAPVREVGTQWRSYVGRLGNRTLDDASRYRGAGFIQLTGRDNYAAAGQALGLPLVDQPELANEPDTAARILAWYFTTRRVTAAAEARDWRRVRVLVNGGLNGWPTFERALAGLDRQQPQLGLLSARGATDPFVILLVAAGILILLVWGQVAS